MATFIKGNPIDGADSYKLYLTVDGEKTEIAENTDLIFNLDEILEDHAYQSGEYEFTVVAVPAESATDLEQSALSNPLKYHFINKAN